MCAAKSARLLRRMKPSGIPWLGDVPEEWEIVPLYKTVCQVKSPNEGMVEKNLLSLSYGRIIRKDMETAFGLVPESYASYNRIEPNDIVLRLTDLQNDQKSLRVGFSQERGIVTSAYLTLRPEGNCFAEYIAYAIKLFDFKKGFYGIGSGVRQSLKFSEVKRFQVPFPPLPEQRAIAERIDCEVARVDALREKIKREIERLGDYKKSLIAETVTRGLRKRKMKPSGIPWLGDVPAEWEVTRLKYEVKIRTETGLYHEGEDCYIGLENVEKDCGGYIATDTKYSNAIYDVCRKNDVLYSRLRPYLSKCLIVPFDGFCTGEFLIFSEFSGDKRFLRYWLASGRVTHEINSSTYGAKMPRASADYILNMSILLPPLREQREIAEYLDRAVSRIDAVIARRKSQLEKLEAFKRSLIQEYVTGKREV